MKSWMYYAAGVTLASSLALGSCNEDDGIDPPVVIPNSAPTVSLRNPSGSDFSGSITDFGVNSKLELVVAAADADDNLKTVTFFRNGNRVTASNGFIQFDGNNDGTPENINSNPVLITTTSSFSETFFFQGDSDFDETTEYTVTVADEEGLETSIDFTIVTGSMGDADVPLVDTSGVFFNRDGSGQGAFDLDSARSVSSNSQLSELQDAGLDQSTSPATWRRVIIAENGAEISRINDEDATNFNYDDVSSLQELRRLYKNRNTVITGTGSNRDTRTLKLNEGDVFIVEAGADDSRNLFLVRVTDINDVATNEDSYTIDYKSGPRDDE